VSKMSAATEYNIQKANEHKALRELGWWPFKSPAGSEAEAEEIKAYQAKKGLKADGMCGPGTWAHLRKDYRPASWLPSLPHGYAEVRAVYGDPKERDGAGDALLVDAAWEKANIVKAVLFNGRHVRFHKALAEELVELHRLASTVSRYTPVSVQTYVPRRKRNGSTPPRPPSTHTFGIAFDVDPAQNAWGMKDSRLHRHPMFAAFFRVAGWRCGIDWSPTDPMHFQAASGC
jgi:hypothetical protein